MSEKGSTTIPTSVLFQFLFSWIAPLTDLGSSKNVIHNSKSDFEGEQIRRFIWVYKVFRLFEIAEQSNRQVII